MSQPAPPNSFGVPLVERVGHVWIGANGVTLAWTFQLVAQRASSKGEVVIGSPVFQRYMPDSCHPPKTACAKRLSVLMKARPLPNGICRTAAAVIMCRTSKSELP